MEIQGKGAHDSRSIARSTAALGVFGVQSRGRREGVGSKETESEKVHS